ncbi:ocs element-binding factor 1 [Musa troglodytarum]|nr:ocs element-binding factor 1 [Musa troglodytarum]
MASPSGTSSGSSLLQNSASEEDRQAVMDQKRQKRMKSNRESARRSRMRKQKHLNDLAAQICQLRKENSQILTSLSLTTQHFFAVETENSVLRTRMMELSSRLQSLDEILHCLNGSNTISNGLFCDSNQIDNSSITPWNLMYMNQQPIMALANIFQY